jgi:Relaxase/Mobilisation nuclease domain
MIPNIKTGSSFRGTALYYLHDKRREGEALRLSHERVDWTVTRNTAHDDPHEAFAEMIAVARDQDRLKIEAGVRLSGRDCDDPVMTISLSWHPSEKPGKEQMVEAADSYLRHMGWEEHQAVYIPHNDRPHAHVHIVLNRIHPETGRVLDDAFSKNRSQEWAQEHGRIWCEERVGKDYSRADGREPDGMPHDFATDARETQRPYMEREEAQQTQDQRERADLAEHHRVEREAFFETRHAQFREARQAAYREVRAEYKPRWVRHFQDADRQLQDARTDGAALALRALRCARDGDFAGAREAFAERSDLLRSAGQDIAAERRELRAEQRSDTRERQDQACKEVYEDRAQAFRDIKSRQKGERTELKELQAARDAHAPHDEARLIELVTVPPTERLAEATRDAAPTRADSRDAPEHPQALEAEAASELAAQPSLLDERAAEPDTAPRFSKRDPALENADRAANDIAGGGERVAGGIGKVAELVADALSNLINPPSPREQAMAKALDAARDEREREHQPARERQDREQRMVQHENQRTATDPFESFFNENAERIRREWEQRWRERDGQDRDR